jgi:hypothetical protein
MRKLLGKAGLTISGFLAVLGLATSVSASNMMIRAIVTDTAGKPIRGAIVKASAGILTVSRYSQNDGRYEIPDRLVALEKRPRLQKLLVTGVGQAVAQAGSRLFHPNSSGGPTRLSV